MASVPGRQFLTRGPAVAENRWSELQLSKGTGHQESLLKDQDTLWSWTLPPAGRGTRGPALWRAYLLGPVQPQGVYEFQQLSFEGAQVLAGGLLIP